MSFLLQLIGLGQDQELDRDVVLNINGDILPGLLYHFKILEPILSESNKRQKTGYSTYGGTNYSYSTASPTSRMEIKIKENLSLLMVIYLEEDMFEMAEAIAAKTIAEARTTPVSVLDSTLIPFLKLILDKILSREAYLKLPTIMNLFQTTLSTYVNRFVGKEPIKSATWARYRRGCGCQECKDLDKFLLDPIKSTQSFAKSYNIRKHYQERLDTENGDYNIQGRVPGPTPILTVTKMPAAALRQYTVYHSAWERRCQSTLVKIRSLADEPRLKEVLGEQFESIIGLKWTMIRPEALSNVENRDPQAAATTEKKVVGANETVGV